MQRPQRLGRRGNSSVLNLGCKLIRIKSSRGTFAGIMPILFGILFVFKARIPGGNQFL
jgi:hypothetical protein